MKLNCKPGCLAIIVKSLAGNEGRVVKCIKFVGDDPDPGVDNEPNLWETDTTDLRTALFDGFGRMFGTGTTRLCPDANMRMLNDPDFTEDTTSQLTHKEKDHV